ncbi:unannotated protein [freshwater metagenome]|uniref:Unannotated protein n=1 Tax=freshwater metagenome TaxID=449393 RepID=A0A6J6IUS5_9ZZZZ|nr:hypothetical protein [Actinomycetota bacterium]MSZ36848.1 hypothetical protein [Actinomycetota bacterium]MTA09457.1 hypothetical protein [Actinomycetota bacterium]MTA68764.1 hypothetical protein [Actinomycetota bacterium]
MALDEADRFRITTKLADTLGQDDAAALMETIPPFDWHQIVTKTDLTNAVKDLATKSDMALEFSTLREEMGIKFSQVDAGFARVDARFEQVDGRFFQVDAKLSDLRTELHKTLRVHFLALITTMVAMNTMMVSLVALLK